MTNVSIKSVYFLVGLLVWGMLAHTPSFAQGKKNVKPQPPLEAGRDGITYKAEANGDRIPDYSYCGYKASEQPIPVVPIKVTVPIKAGDATLRIQSALDYVASLPADKNGIRGAVLLEKGTYQLTGSLKLNASGVVLRGSGMGKDGTTLVSNSTDRGTFIQMLGKSDRKVSEPVKISDAYVPVNAMSFHVASGSYKVGDQILVNRPSTKNWIEVLKMQGFGGGVDALGWKPGDRDIHWDRTITAVNGNTITIDAPLTTALDTTYGGGTINTYQWTGRIEQVGIENLRLVSIFDKTNAKDEAHRWMAITIENTRDAWVRQVTFEHFAGSAVFVLETANRVTIEDCKSLSPVSEIGGQRRNTFWTMGGQTLFQRLHSEWGYHDFAAGFCAPGPNAFVQCQSWRSYSFSGSIDSWASGVLFDIVNIDGQALSYKNREQDGQGAGWNAANSLFWNCTAARVDCYAPPTANNWAFGTWAQFAGDGYWGDSNNSISPRSFYYAQLAQRLKKDVADQGKIMPFSGEASSSPTVEQAAAMVAKSHQPAVTISDWIDKIAQKNVIPVKANGIKTVDQIGVRQPVTPAMAAALKVSNGWLVRGNSVIAGMHYQVPWWSGTVRPNFIERGAKPHVTRWVPGRTGTGLTDDVNEVSDWMKSKHIVVMEHNYGLWTDRRRDDHERVRRMDGDVWPPFYELPFARTGIDTAWDGLSKYDLYKYNKWYWSRLKQFADLADQKGLVLIHHNYFQHNIIEAGAHYAEFPWRPVNNINHTGFPEPPPYAGDKRIFMADQFYDETNAARRKIHQAYIRQCLDNFSGNNGVIQFIGEEFTGPQHFVEFWLQTIQQWEKEKGKKEIIGLSTTKDVQDGILGNTALAPTVDVIDIRYWHYNADGTLYAPLGGQNLAPRQQARQFKPKASSFEQVYRAVSEYRIKFPDKAVLYSADGYDNFGWAVFMAGGSLPVLPATTDAKLLDAVAGMKPVISSDTKGVYILGDPIKGYLVYTASGDAVKLPLTDNADYTVYAVDPKTGKPDWEAMKGKGSSLKGSFKNPDAAKPMIYWFKRN